MNLDVIAALLQQASDAIESAGDGMPGAERSSLTFARQHVLEARAIIVDVHTSREHVEEPAGAPLHVAT